MSHSETLYLDPDWLAHLRTKITKLMKIVSIFKESPGWARTMSNLPMQKSMMQLAHFLPSHKHMCCTIRLSCNHLQELAVGENNLSAEAPLPGVQWYKKNGGMQAFLSLLLFK